MIIPGDSPPLRKGDDPTQQHISPTPPESSGPPPPPYTNYPTPSQPQYVVTAVVAETREPASRRFVRAFLVAVSVWVLAGIFVSSAVELHRSTHWSNVGGPTFADGRVGSCVPWTRVSAGEHPRLPLPASGVWSQAKLNLSADADALYLTARGVHASSHLYVSESHEAKEVSVGVFVQHRRATSLSRATVCRLSRGSGEMGVGIFTPSHWHTPWFSHGRDLRFVVQVELPAIHDVIRYIPSFHADLPLFAANMGDLSAFHFGDVDLKSSNSPIKVEGIVAKSLKIHAMNGAISGNFNTTSSLTLITTNSPVSARISTANGGPGKSTDVLIQTDNAPIEADILLTSKSPLGTSGAFGVHAHTTNGPVKIVFGDSPVDFVLDFKAQSTNSPVHAVLPHAYEGTFSLQTTNSRVVLEDPHRVEDPSGRGRERLVSKHSVSRQFMYGEIEWSPSSHDNRASALDIATTNAPVTLSI